MLCYIDPCCQLFFLSQTQAIQDISQCWVFSMIWSICEWLTYLNQKYFLINVLSTPIISKLLTPYTRFCLHLIQKWQVKTASTCQLCRIFSTMKFKLPENYTTQHKLGLMGVYKIVYGLSSNWTLFNNVSLCNGFQHILATWYVCWHYSLWTNVYLNWSPFLLAYLG